MGLIAVFLFCFAITVSCILIFLGSLLIKRLDKSNWPNNRNIAIAMTIVLGVVFNYYGFTLFPIPEYVGAPTGEFYDSILARSIVIGISPGVGFSIGVAIQTVLVLVRKNDI